MGHSEVESGSLRHRSDETKGSCLFVGVQPLFVPLHLVRRDVDQTEGHDHDRGENPPLELEKDGRDKRRQYHRKPEERRRQSATGCLGRERERRDREPETHVQSSPPESRPRPPEPEWLP